MYLAYLRAETLICLSLHVFFIQPRRHYSQNYNQEMFFPCELYLPSIFEHFEKCCLFCEGAFV